MKRPARGMLAAMAVALLGGCASTIPRNGISDPQLAEKASVPNLPNVRFWADEVPTNPIAELKKRLPNMPRLASAAHKVGQRPVVETLALSGGGSDGAFGAGVLAGWTARGDRPEFEIVTGVSAGAIIAPFAFLGPQHDIQLREIWTQFQTNELVTTQLLGLFGGPALADTTPLQNLIARYVDRDLMREIAAEYSKGRILMVLTTNLDAQRPVVWNMGEIARADTDEALTLFRRVILASAAIPGAFPPVNIPVVADAAAYEEMHVDGGTTREVFVLPVQAPYKAFDPLYSAPPIRKIYIIKNGKISPEPEVVQAKTLAIATRAIYTLTKNQNINELYRIYRQTTDAGADFNMVSVPASFSMKSKEFFDPKYLAALYAEGEQIGRDGNHWLKAPPGTPAEEPGKPAPAPPLQAKKAPVAKVPPPPISAVTDPAPAGLPTTPAPAEPPIPAPLTPEPAPAPSASQPPPDVPSAGRPPEVPSASEPPLPSWAPKISQR